jgi:putative transposase
VAELFLMRGFEFTHETVRDWEERFAPLFTEQLRSERKRDWRRQIGKNWQVDETYIKVKNEWCYLHRAIDNFGNLVDCRLSKNRDLEAAKAFFRQALAIRNKRPEKVTTDKHSSYPRAIKKILGRKVEQRTSKYLNNFMEQDHRGIKARIKPMLSFKSV